MNVKITTAMIMCAFLGAIALNECKLDPAKVPPCTGRETFPDPCAAALRDAGAG